MYHIRSPRLSVTGGGESPPGWSRVHRRSPRCTGAASKPLCNVRATYHAATNNKAQEDRCPENKQTFFASRGQSVGIRVPLRAVRLRTPLRSQLLIVSGTEITFIDRHRKSSLSNGRCNRKKTSGFDPVPWLLRDLSRSWGHPPTTSHHSVTAMSPAGSVLRLGPSVGVLAVNLQGTCGHLCGTRAWSSDFLTSHCSPGSTEVQAEKS